MTLKQNPMVATMSRLDSSEHPPYYGKYIQLVPEGDIVQTMGLQIEDTLRFLRSVPPLSGDRRYAPDKWSIKEVVGHLMDCERVFAQRALYFARNCPGPLPSIEPEEWVTVAGFGRMQLGDLINEFELVRRSNVLLFKGLSDEAWTRRGIASDMEFTVRSFAYIIVGHERHHLEILKTRYL